MAMRSSSELWTEPQRIQFKISPVDDLFGVVGGDWDQTRRFSLDDALKHRSIRQRYVDGAPWEETDLFCEAYAARLDRGEGVRGCATMLALLEQYYDRVDGMFDDMRRRGFDAAAGPLPTFFIGRDDEIFLGNQGNHRLAMAQIIGLKRIAGRVVCRHSTA